MENTKYEMIAEYGTEFYCIKSLVNIDCINLHKDSIGGYIENQDNLSTIGNAWISDKAQVYDHAYISDNAQVYGIAWVYGNAHVYGDARVFGNAHAFDNACIHRDARVFSNAKVFGHAMVYDCAQVYDNARVYGDARVFGNTKIYGYSRILGNAIICGDAQIFGDAWVYGNACIGINGYIEHTTDYLFIGPIGSRDDCTTFYRTKDRGIYAYCGCFNNSLDAFEKRVKEVHGEDQYGADYLAAISFAKAKLL